MRHSFVVIALILFVGCSPTKFVPEGSYMLSGVEVKSHDKNFDPEGLEAYVRQRGNSRWFSSLKIPLGVYSLAGRDTTRWINRTLRRAGEAPILFDEDQAQRSKEDLERAMQNRGYLNAKAELHTEKKGKSLRAIYDLYPGQSYQIGKLDYEIEDTVLANIILSESSTLTEKRYSVDALENERKRIVSLLNNNGFYRFHKDFITFEADTTASPQARQVDLVMHIQGVNHPRYLIGNVNYQGGNDEKYSFAGKRLRVIQP